MVNRGGSQRSPRRALSARAGPLFCGNVLQDRLVQAQFGHKLLEAPVLVLQLLEFPNLVRLQSRVLLLPAVERLLRDPTCRRISATGIPNSACLSTATICSTENRFFFTTNLLSSRLKFAEKANIEFGPEFSTQINGVSPTKYIDPSLTTSLWVSFRDQAQPESHLDAERLLRHLGATDDEFSTVKREMAESAGA